MIKDICGHGSRKGDAKKSEGVEKVEKKNRKCTNLHHLLAPRYEKVKRVKQSYLQWNLNGIQWVARSESWLLINASRNLVILFLLNKKIPSGGRESSAARKISKWKWFHYLSRIGNIQDVHQKLGQPGRIGNLKQCPYLNCSYLKMGSHDDALAVSFFRRSARLRSCSHDFHYSIEKRSGKLGRYASSYRNSATRPTLTCLANFL